MKVTEEAAIEIASNIRSQIGSGSLYMIGAKNLMRFNDETGVGLQFKICRNAKKVTHITVTLDGDDTYTVKFTKVGRAPSYKITDLAIVDRVYASDLKGTIENNTGLALSL